VPICNGDFSSSLCQYSLAASLCQSLFDIVNEEHGPCVWAVEALGASVDICPACVFHPNHHHPGQMSDGRHHDPHVERKLVRTGLREDVALEEHAGPFAKLNDWAGHALWPEGKMRRGVEGDGIKLRHMANFVRAFRASVLTSHDIAAQVDGNSILTVHPALQAQCLDRPPALDRGIEFVDPLAETKGVHIPAGPFTPPQQPPPRAQTPHFHR
jgi:hypothetical protein